MEALITGADGFLGRHFSAALKKRGWIVHRLDIKHDPTQDCLRFFRRPVDEPGERIPFDLVLHCAAVIGGRAVIDGDPLATAVNLELDAAMFRWAAAARPGRVVYFSSSAVYPVSLQTGSGLSLGRLNESDVWHRSTEGIPLGSVGVPDQVYGWSKLMGEVLASRLRELGVPVTVVRPFSGYGSDQDEDYPFRAILERVRRWEDPLTVWSDAVRDFIHVDDIVAATLAAVDQGLSGPVNLCTGKGASFSRLARLMAEEAGYKPAIDVLPGKPTGVRHRVGDPSKMLSFHRPMVKLEEGVRRALSGG